MIRHGMFGAQTCSVGFNGCCDKLLRDVVVVLGTWTATFTLQEFLRLDDGYLWFVFFDGFPSPLGTGIIPIIN